MTYWRNLKSEISSLSVGPEVADRILDAVNEGTELESWSMWPEGEVILIQFVCPVLEETRWAVKAITVHSDILDFEAKSAAEKHFLLRKGDIESGHEGPPW